MMDSRLRLHNMLKSILSNGSIYYQPPASIKMMYPAIVYKRNKIDSVRADNNWYLQNNSYKIVVIDKNVDSNIVINVSRLPMCTHTAHYEKDGLSHDVFNIVI